MISKFVSWLNEFLWKPTPKNKVRTIRKLLQRYLFDQEFYFIINPDIRKSQYGTKSYGGLKHFMDYGRKEGRTWRTTPAGLRRLRLHVAWLRVRSDHWSGLRIISKLPGAPSGDGEVVVVRLFSLAIRRLPFSAAEVESDGGIQVNWPTEPDSAGRAYLVYVRWLGRLIEFANVDNGISAPVMMAGGKIHSPGKSPWRLPRALVVSPVTQCNLNCIHCISRFTRKTLNILPDRIWEEIEDGIRSDEIKHLASDYSGDIFHSSAKRGPFLDRMIASGADLRFDTHANDLTDDVVDKLLSSKLFGINFSLDAMKLETYRKIRHGARPHHEVLANIRNFMQKKNRERPEISTMLSFVMMRSNIDEVKDAIDFVADTGIDVFQGGHLMVFTADMVEESLLLDPIYYAAKRTEIVAHAEQRHRPVRLLLPDPVFTPRPRRGHRPCIAPFETAMILGNGDVLACCMPGSKIGNLEGTTLAEFWNGPAFRAFRSKVNSNDPPPVCDTCPIYRFENNFGSYVPGLSEPERADFEALCIAARQGGPKHA